jgi:hypothetical protein
MGIKHKAELFCKTKVSQTSSFIHAWLRTLIGYCFVLYSFVKGPTNARNREGTKQAEFSEDTLILSL